MKVLLVNRFFYPDPSGTSRMLTDLALDLSRTGIRVSVITSRTRCEDTDALYPREEVYEGIRIYRIPTWRFNRQTILGWVLNCLSFYPTAFVKIIRLPKHDVVVFLSDPPLIFVLGPIIRWLKGSCYACWSQDVYPDVAVRLRILKGGSLSASILDTLSRWGLRKAEGVVAIGEFMAECIKRKGVSPEKVQVIHNWEDGERIRPVQPEINGFLEKHGLWNKFIILYSGNMGVGHHFETILEASRHFKHHEDVLFLFIGGGKQAMWLKEQTRDIPNVRFHPHQSDKDLPFSLSSGHVHLVTLKPDLAGIIVPSKVYSSLACGRPIVYIGPPRSEVAQIIEQAGCGMVVPPGDGPGLIKALSSLHEDRDLVSRLGQNGRVFFNNFFDRRIAVQRFSDLLHHVMFIGVRPAVGKRIFDILLSGLGLLLSAPLWALFALMIWLEDRAPVFFKDVRVGQEGRRFNALKFRTMIPNADAKFGLLQACENDPRVTRVGKLLRTMAMDELPQLWNIFQGEMSFVGPRALRPVEIEVKSPGPGAMSAEDVPNFHLRYRVRPGLTGLAQIYAPRDATRRQKLRFDLLYIRCQSLRLDLKLIALSFWITFRGKWESRKKKI